MLLLENIQDIQNRSGFVYAPFHRKTNFPIVFFEPEIIIDNDTIPDELLSKLDRKQPLYPFTEQEDPFIISKDEYLTQVDKMKSVFDNSFSKGVLSRVKKLSVPPDFKLPEFYFSLTKNYPDAFCHLINIPGNGCWVGASPEVLLRNDGGNYQTVALAGTAPFRGGSTLVWGKKEKDEQEMVSRHVEDIFSRMEISDYHKSDPDDFRAGQVVHRRTRFHFPEKAIAGRVHEFLSLLHPTPAVCGLPQEKALQLLLDMEKHNREYYAGYCGPLNLEGKTDLFVNLRCMKILPHLLALYVGGGITSLSDPTEEWKETELKAATLLSMIQ